jgi:hypothetical protein
MEEITSVTTPALTLCNACYKHVNEADAFCDNCGYPLKGTEKEQDYFIAVRNAKEIDLDAANKAIKRAGNTLYWIAGATVLMGVIFYFTIHDEASKIDLLIVNLILAGIYVGLGAWSRKKPLAAIISGFALYLIVFLLNAITNPTTIASGIIVKILFIGYFIKGIKSAIDAEKIKKELNIE